MKKYLITYHQIVFCENYKTKLSKIESVITELTPEKWLEEKRQNLQETEFVPFIEKLPGIIYIKEL